MNFELSLQIKILALVGLVLAAGAAGTLVLSHERSASTSAPIPATHTIPANAVTHKTHTLTHQPSSTAHAPAVALDANLPAPLRQALRYSRIVVAVVHAPGDAVDAEVLAQAQAGAASQHAGFVALDVRDDKVAAATAAWMKTIFEPAVLVVARPGKIVVELDGYADSATVAQAVANSRR